MIKYNAQTTIYAIKNEFQNFTNDYLQEFVNRFTKRIRRIQKETERKRKGSEEKGKVEGGQFLKKLNFDFLLGYLYWGACFQPSRTALSSLSRIRLSRRFMHIHDVVLTFVKPNRKQFSSMILRSNKAVNFH